MITTMEDSRRPTPSTTLLASLDVGLAGGGAGGSSSIDRRGQQQQQPSHHQQHQLRHKQLQAEGTTAAAVAAVPAVSPSSESLTVINQHRTSNGPMMNQQQNHASSGSVTFDSSSILSPLNQMDVDEFSVVRQPAHRERRFRRLFRNVPTTEILLCRFSCAYVSDLGLLLQGHLYVSNNWICFHSNIFGIEKIIEIPVGTIASVSKAHTAKIIPNAVKIKTQSKYYLFGSLISRDNTYRLLISVTAARNGVDDADLDSVVNHGVKEEERIRGIGDADDDVSSLSSLSTTSSSDDDVIHAPTLLVAAHAAASAENATRMAQPLLEKRLLQLNNKNAAGTACRNSCRGNIMQRILPKFSAHGLVTWFFNLPKIFIILLLCVILLTFLFMCATFLTVRLIYIQNPRVFWWDFLSWKPAAADMQRFALPRTSLESMGAVIESTLKLVTEAKTQLETLQFQVRSLMVEVSSANGHSESSSSHGVPD